MASTRATNPRERGVILVTDLSTDPEPVDPNPKRVDGVPPWIIAGKQFTFTAAVRNMSSTAMTAVSFHLIQSPRLTFLDCLLQRVDRLGEVLP